MNQSGDSNAWHDANYIPLFSLAISGVFASLGNGLLIFVLVRRLKSRQPYELLILNAAVADFCIATLDVFIEPIFVTRPESLGCKVVGTIVYMLGFMIFAQPPLITFNR